MANVIRVAGTRQAADPVTQQAIDSLARDVEMRSKFGTDDPDNTISGKIYFKLGSTTSGRWTKLDSVWIAT